MTFTYDGGLVTEMAWSGVANGTYRYRYDNNFSLVGMQLDDEPEIEMKRDADGLLTQYGQFQVVRNLATGAPTQITDGKMNVDIEYDNSGRVISRTNLVNGRVIYQLQLSYDVLSRIVQKRETVTGTTHIYDYTYDLDGQLILVRRDSEVVERYVYDDNGNRTEWQLGAQQHTASYDAQDRLIELDGTPYEFDADGFLMQRGDMTLKYSATGELLEVSWPDGKAINYTYDSMNRRVARTDKKGTEQYLYGNPNHPFPVTAMRDNSGKLSVYEYDDFGSLFSLKRDANLYYLVTDQLGTPRVVCDVNGRAIKVLDYNSFGQQIADSNFLFDLPISFAGGLIEPDTKLVRFGFRDYDAVAAKWTAKDPIRFIGGDANLYSYVSNEPINFLDRQGTDRLRFDIWAYYGLPGDGGKTNTFAYGTVSWINDQGKEIGLYPIISGQWGKGALPEGNYKITQGPIEYFDKTQDIYARCLDSVSGKSWWLAVKPTFKTTRGDFGFHPDGGTPGTAGCLGIPKGVDSSDLYQRFKDYDISPNHPLYLDVVGPGSCQITR
ncbi:MULTISPECIES: RHS repeat-associated core domain-containing protein [unclassified Microcoleus]|uniref:RHS repeat-associated core domain-containing protein n=1 Tax=unclassified Microcoleus TaxID=2642155 RepID=UPI002FD192FD